MAALVANLAAAAAAAAVEMGLTGLIACLLSASVVTALKRHRDKAGQAGQAANADTTTSQQADKAPPPRAARATRLAIAFDGAPMANYPTNYVHLPTVRRVSTSKIRAVDFEEAPSAFSIADGSKTPISGHGTMVFGNEHGRLALQDTLCVPGASEFLFSITFAILHGLRVYFKLVMPGKRYVMLGYSDRRHDGYKLWDLLTDKVIESCDVVFDESHPHSYDEAMASAYAAEWHAATEAEIHSLTALYVYELVLRPAGKILKAGWVYKLRFHADLTVNKFKACYVARESFETGQPSPPAHPTDPPLAHPHTLSHTHPLPGATTPAALAPLPFGPPPLRHPSSFPRAVCWSGSAPSPDCRERPAIPTCIALPTYRLTPSSGTPACRSSVLKECLYTGASLSQLEATRPRRTACSSCCCENTATSQRYDDPLAIKQQTGTLDSMVVLSDELGKQDSVAEAITNKLVGVIRTLLCDDNDQIRSQLPVSDSTVSVVPPKLPEVSPLFVSLSAAGFDFYCLSPRPPTLLYKRERLSPRLRGS
ncbi:MAG: hypothetical protein BJ554DRAFT_8393 [Olpidium bornovanus]|uniref:V-type proton ATPase subunit C n=1 Tax=Olpidium bornovanus TaxID=278681 RepID=A0A8H7ZUU5_9FUNG|nr:MAG: hypothetical protein BJ554DRAFT_8393 [Olpidium bornovanus]